MDVFGDFVPGHVEPACDGGKRERGNEWPAAIGRFVKKKSPRRAKSRVMISRRAAVGLGMLSVVVMDWVGEPYVIQRIIEDGVEPLFMSYVGGSLFALCLLIDRRERIKIPYMVPRALLWMSENGLNNLSLKYTNITDFTIMSTTMGLWALFFSIRWGLEKAHGTNLPVRIFGGVLTVVGAAVSTYGDSSGHGSTALVGDVLAFLSNAIFGIYITSLKIGDSIEKRPLQYFGQLGVRVFLLGSGPMVAYLALSSSRGTAFAMKTGFAKPSGFGRDFAIFAVKGLVLTAPSEFLLAQAAVRTSPTIVAVGTSLTIPLAFLVDAFITRNLPLHDPSALALQIIGAIIVVIGFIITALYSPTPDDESCSDAEKHDDSDDVEADPAKPFALMEPLITHGGDDYYSSSQETDGTCSATSESGRTTNDEFRPRVVYLPPALSPS